MRRHVILIVPLLLLAVACTGRATNESVTPSGLRAGEPTKVTVRGRQFDVSCTPVAEALVDVKLPHAAGQPTTRAITGLWDRQAVAVLANDRSGCGVWVLGLAADLSPAAVDAIRVEVAAGIEHFGVTESPVPRDESG